MAAVRQERRGVVARLALVQTFRELANIAAGALVFGQALGDRPFSLALALVAVALWVALLTGALVLARENHR